MITLSDVRAAVTRFETNTEPSLSNAFDALRRAAVEAVRDYAAQEGLAVAQVVELLK